MPFHDLWMGESQLWRLVRLAELSNAVPGACLELGVWEGRSALRIAEAIRPATLHAVDTWGGNITEGPEHPTVRALRERDVYADCRTNIAEFGAGNIVLHRMDVLEFLRAPQLMPWRFVHIDAAHDYASVRATLALVMPQMAPGGILCGDDYAYPDVRRAVDETLGAAVHSIDNLWGAVTPATGWERACRE